MRARLFESRTPPPAMPPPVITPAMLDRVRASLWGLYIGDALAMPTHWYYDQGHLRRTFGQIKGYVAPMDKLPGSIMSLSNTGARRRSPARISTTLLVHLVPCPSPHSTCLTSKVVYRAHSQTGGGGRGGFQGSIVGDVILKGKKQYWDRGGNWFYHRGMSAGENTLEGVRARVPYMYGCESLRKHLQIVLSSAFELKLDQLRFFCSIHTHRVRPCACAQVITRLITKVIVDKGTYDHDEIHSRNRAAPSLVPPSHPPTNPLATLNLKL